MINRRILTLLLFASVIGLAACDEETVTGPGFICDVSNPIRDLILLPSNPLVLVHAPALESDTVKLTAIATNRFGQGRNDIAFSFTSSDTTVATVNAAGIVTARRPGTATITAAACGESRTVQLTVISTVGRVTITPAADTVVAGDTAIVTAHAFALDNTPVPNVVFTFGSPSPSVSFVQTSDSTAKVVTSPTASGTVSITATGEGTVGTASLLVLARVFLPGSVVSNSLDGGDDMVCGIISAGQLFCWGLNNVSQLGAATDSTCFSGAELTQTLGEDTVFVGNQPCSLRPLRVSRELDFASVSAGDETTCALNLTGSAYCWGLGDHGEMGDGSVASATEPSLVNSPLTFTTISTGGTHVCALAAGGAAYCWGNDLDGQLGDARGINSTTPIPVSDGGGGAAVFSSISAGYRHTCALNSAGVAFCWGNNDFGQLGAGVVGGISSTPVVVAGGLTFQSISSGGDHTCGVTTAGGAFCWGSNSFGQLGTGAIGGIFPAPVAVAGGLTFTRISASSGSSLLQPGSVLPFKVAAGHTCGLTNAGAIFCWGDNRDLQLGQGPATGGSSPNGTPVQVQGGQLPSSVNFVSVTTSVRNGCGVGTDGAAYCWGSNVYGALGNTLQAAFRGFPQKVATPRS